MRTTGVFLTGMILTAGMLFSGCSSPKVVYGDARSARPVSTDFGSNDLQQVAERMVSSMLTFPPIVRETAGRRPIIVVSKVKNKTMQHIDTESITDSIRTKLIRSGKFRFIDRTTDEAAIDEVRTQQESGLSEQESAVQFGEQLNPEFMLTSNLSEIKQRNEDVIDVYYKFTMNLKNLRTGILEWSDEKEIRKQMIK